VCFCEGVKGAQPGAVSMLLARSTEASTVQKNGKGAGRGFLEKMITLGLCCHRKCITGQCAAGTMLSCEEERELER
jgi:secreted PhoX family phosphatase